MKLSVKLACATLALAASAANAVQVPVSCPGTATTTDREFTVWTDPGTAGCLLTGTGNINGNGDAINALGYILIDKSDDATDGTLTNALSPGLTSGLSGQFSFVAPGYSNFVIAFKSGKGELNPDWAAFTLPAGVTSGDWSISGEQALSHVNLYGKVSAVPLPAAVWLLGSALGVGSLFRRRKLAAS